MSKVYDAAGEVAEEPESSMIHPSNRQEVEILVDGEWKRATFHQADSIATSEDEIWWMDYFSLENGETIPEDTTEGIADKDMPQWRLRR